MDNIGSEISQKMRSAVKAKLIELGTGGTSGYIDDELPDYVMIMVANKRGKQQMKSDLNLFLGAQTDLFVTWLYEVLQKLQEVTLPVSNKRKSGDREESTNKREKKDKKREKKFKKSPDNQVITSITEVITGQVIEKAKQDLLIDAVKAENEFSTSDGTLLVDQFNIPTISEMNANISVGIPRRSREEDLAELAAIQKQIYETKRQLKQIYSGDESEDGDFLNIKEEAEEFDDDVEKKNKVEEKSPTVSNKDKNCEDETNNGTGLIDSDVEMAEAVEIPVPPVPTCPLVDSVGSMVENTEDSNISINMEVEDKKKASIHDRLGVKSFKSTDSIANQPVAHRRIEKEIYVPVFRRRAMEEQKLREEMRNRNEEFSDEELSKSNNRNRINDKINRAKSIERANSSRNRVGSHVIVAPKNFKSKGERQEIERPVNSVIKIKPRPTVSPSKQACKNLLLRAVAEAQKSIILAKSKVTPPPYMDKIQQLYTKSYRNRANRDSLLNRTKTDNLFIEVNSCKDTQASIEEEYVPEVISDRDGSQNDLQYIPKSIRLQNPEQSEDEEITDTDYSYESNNQTPNNTQFVVTLDETAGEKFNSRLISKASFRKGYKSKITKMNQGRLFSNAKSRIQIKRKQPLNKRLQEFRTPSPQLGQKTGLIEIYRKPRDVKKIIIQNDSEDDSSIKQKNALDQIITDPNLNRSRSNSNEFRSTTPPLPAREVVFHFNKLPIKRRRSPIKFDLNEQKSEEQPRLKNNMLDESNKSQNISSASITDGESGNLGGEHDCLKISTRKSEVNKYDNVPELLSSVSIDLARNKSKERCKYYPSCTKGDLCEFYHPTLPCKAFPNCKFSDKCLYIHPKCKFDLTCTKIGCNFSHSVSLSNQSTAPPISSHVVPSQNFKLLMSSGSPTTPATCKYYPNCNNTHCTFFHPRLCRFGKNCINKVDCNFYHQEVPSKDKFKWVASAV